MEKNKFSKNLKASKILLVKDVESNCINQIEEKIGNKNVATFYHIACIFNFTELSKLSLCHIERCFPLVCENINFKQLDFDLIAKIISSSELNTDSEIEVFNAADNWIAYNFEERSKFASRLLGKVRLNLLSVDALKSIIKCNVSFNKIDDVLLTSVLKNNKSTFQKKTSRYCSQQMFNIVVSGGFTKRLNRSGRNTVRKNNCFYEKFSVENCSDVKVIAPMKTRRENHKLVYCRGAVYVFGGVDENKKFVKSIDKYSLVTNKWENVSEMFDYRKFFCASRFIDQIFIIGGYDDYWLPSNSTLKFCTKANKWSEVARMNEARILCSCAIYEGRVVVSGGWNYQNHNGLKTVEAYDHVSDKWSSMPNMIERRYRHSLLAMKNKLFVLGGCTENISNSCEVFDSESKKFVFLKQNSTSLVTKSHLVNNTFLIGSKIITLCENSKTISCYDVEKDEWSEETFDITEDLYCFSSTIIPKI